MKITYHQTKQGMIWVTDEPIEVNDWFICFAHEVWDFTIEDKILQRLVSKRNPEFMEGWINGVYESKGELLQGYHPIEHCKKIIATSGFKIPTLPNVENCNSPQELFNVFFPQDGELPEWANTMMILFCELSHYRIKM